MHRDQISPNVEVRGAIVLAVVEVMRAFRSVALRVLAKNGIVDPQPDHWYSLKDWIASFDTIVKDVGPNTLHQIGRHVSGTAPIPPNIDNVQDALSLLDEQYLSQHRGGDVGHYHYFHTGERTATIISSTPYPSDFDRGVITSLIERFENDSLLHVDLDPKSETRKNGATSCTFLVQW
ncbi:MAG: hypothetical protein AAGE94_07125 [Acidobacteriota bacterium]